MQKLSEEYSAKVVEHEVKKDFVKFNKEKIEQLQKTLNDEKEQLDKLNKEQYKLLDDFCNTVWNFSRKHDFGNFFVNYPRQKIPSPCNCEYFDETAERIQKEIQKDQEIQKLTLEIDKLKLELEDLKNKNKNLKENDESKSNSNSLQISFQEDVEILRLAKILKKSQQSLEFLETEIRNHQENDVSPKNVEINSTPKTKAKVTEKWNEKPSKKLKLTKELSNTNQSPLLSCPNTVDNYLIIKKKINSQSEEKNHQMKEEKVMEKFQLKDVNEQKSAILSSWNRKSNVSFHHQKKDEKVVERIQLLKEVNEKKSGILSSWNQDSVSYISTEKSIPNDCFLAAEEKLMSVESIFKNAQIEMLVPEVKLRGFTPKKQSSVAEKLKRN